MKYSLFLVICLLVVNGSISCNICKEVPAINPESTHIANTFVPFGVNLAGAEFSEAKVPSVCETDYFYPTIAELDYFKDKGLMLIRFPFRWERIQCSFGGELD